MSSDLIIIKSGALIAYTVMSHLHHIAVDADVLDPCQKFGYDTQGDDNATEKLCHYKGMAGI